MVEHLAAGSRIDARARCREEVLPGEARRRFGHLPEEGVRKIDEAPPGRALGAVAGSDGFHLRPEAIPRAGREERGAIMLALATTHRDLMALEVDILDADGQRFEEAEAAAIQDFGEQAERELQVIEERHDLAAREDRREMVRPAGPLQVEELRHVETEDAAVEEDESAEGLILRRSRDPALDGEMIEERGDLRGAKGARVSATLEGNERARPVNIGFLGAG